MGSKSRIAKYIVPILQCEIDNSQPSAYIEPMVGGANVIDKINYPVRLGLDNNKYLITLLSNPDRVSTLSLEPIKREEYNRVRTIYRAGNPNQEEDDWYIAAVGFFGSYNGRFFDGGYGICPPRNNWKERIQNFSKQIPKLKQIDFAYCSYQDLPDISNCVIYCDPPYAQMRGYDSAKQFNYDQFWNWVRKVSQNNKVFVSETQAPDDFETIWEQEIVYCVNNTRRKSAVEKLFKLRQ